MKSESKARTYRMTRRAEQVDGTRQRIVEAAAHLHGTVGPAATTIAGIAERAGVTRPTVYRHFADEEAIFDACSAHWMARRTPPDPAAWAARADPVERLRAGLADLYRFYRDGEPMLTRVQRDRGALSASRRAAFDAGDAHLRAVLAGPFGGDRRAAALIGHAVSFWTWRSLCLDHGLTDAEAVDAMVALVTAA